MGLERGRAVCQPLPVTKRSPIRSFRARPEIIRLAVMKYIRFPLPRWRTHADLLSPGDQALVFIGAAAFGDVAGQVRYAAGVLEVDLSGDGRADLTVILSGAPVLVANDLSL